MGERIKALILSLILAVGLSMFSCGGFFGNKTLFYYQGCCCIGTDGEVYKKGHIQCKEDKPDE